MRYKKIMAYTLLVASMMNILPANRVLGLSSKESVQAIQDEKVKESTSLAEEEIVESESLEPTENVGVAPQGYQLEQPMELEQTEVTEELEQAEEPEQPKIGWIQDGDKWYFYNEDSTIKKGLFKQGEVLYYLDDNTGERKTGVININGNEHYFNLEGIMEKNWFKIEGRWYLADSSGILQKGWYKEDNSLYYIKAQGEMAVGFVNEGGKSYYLNSSGRMEKNWFKIEGRWYLADSSGVLKNGWLWEGNSWYYIKEQGEMAVGFVNVGGRDYYLNSAGLLQSGWFIANGKWYLAESSGALKNGWYWYSNNWYFLKPQGEMAIGWVLDGGKWYYMNPTGTMKTGWVNTSSNWYYLESNGSMAVGWKYLDGKWYYLKNAGEMAVGLTEINGAKYYLDGSGAMKTGWVNIDNKLYFFNSDGTMSNGWIKKDGDFYYINENNEMKIGNFEENGKEYYFHADGKMATFEYIGEKYYGKDGVAKSFEKGDKILVVLDPGHNFGGDDGAYATHNGIRYSERDLNMQLALKVKSELEANGYEVVLTREGEDRDKVSMRESLKKRVDLANGLRTDMFISLHHDSFPTSGSNGITSFYGTYRPNIESSDIVDIGDDFVIDKTPSKAARVSRDFSNALSKTVSSEMGYLNRGSKDWWLYVTRYTTMPSILLEAGFISNENEAKRAADPANQVEFARKITKELNNIFHIR